jgi:transposase
MIAVGIDIAKRTLDVWMDNKLTKLNNNELELETLFGPIKRDGVQIVMEATSKYHRIAHRTLSTLGFDVMVINPFQSRHFAKAMNVLCKTDKVDAKVLSQYAQRMDFVKTHVASDTEETLQNFVRYSDDLKGMLIQYKHHLEGAEGVILASLGRLVKITEKEICMITKKIEALIKSDEQLTNRCEILTSIPGIGKATAATLVALIKESILWTHFNLT